MRGRSVALGAVASYASLKAAAVDVDVSAAAAATVFYLCTRSALNSRSLLATTTLTRSLPHHSLCQVRAPSTNSLTHTHSLSLSLKFCSGRDNSAAKLMLPLYSKCALLFVICYCLKFVCIIDKPESVREAEHERECEHEHEHECVRDYIFYCCYLFKYLWFFAFVTFLFCYLSRYLLHCLCF